MYSQNPVWMLALALIFPGISGVAAVDIYTSGNVEARNGTEKRLKCTFQSSSPVSKRTTVTWHFRHPDSSNEESVFYYHEEPFPPSGGRFKDRISWSGNIWKKDGSITISNLQFTDNGTFLCSVKNPPDVHGVAGEIKLSVVHKVTYSEMMILGIVIGCATGLVVLIVIAVVGVQLLRKNQAQQEEEEMEYVEEKELNYEHQNGILCYAVYSDPDPKKGSSVMRILHYQSEVFPAHSGPFKDRVLWNGDVTKGNASIILKNLTQNDNGTFSCMVQNPPDVSSEMPSTVLTVTERELPFRLSVAVVLVLLVVIPSLLVVTVHLLWMGKRFGFYGVNSKNTSIEVLEGRFINTMIFYFSAVFSKSCNEHRQYDQLLPAQTAQSLRNLQLCPYHTNFFYSFKSRVGHTRTDEGESDQGNRICFCCVSCFQESDEEDEDFHRFYPASESVT
ncbi:uncharacterized protein LOC122540533 [Chiloscyllium plagiosum]|uniref:uncharacterized protein LOC122540533 n=1 Tax=Chiloscyllium plagiosum TaxID=36176 RepID=UPI001CB86BFC|nr:uncharacterized protein LOC122540533 [Chiloscyllium plagiosum]